MCVKKHHIGRCPALCFFRQRISTALCLGDLIYVTSKPSSFLNILMTDASRKFYCLFQILILLLPVYLRKQHASLLHHYRFDPTLGLPWCGFWFCRSEGFVSFGLIQLLVSVLWKLRSDRVLLVALCQSSLKRFLGGCWQGRNRFFWKTYWCTGHAEWILLPGPTILWLR